MKLEKYSLGIGDRFGHQGEAQLTAIKKADDMGVSIAPVWNKSFREHSIIGTDPGDTRKEADGAVANLGWDKAYYVDADHINLKTVDIFLPHSNFFTIDVADFIGQKSATDALAGFIENNTKYIGTMQIPGIAEKFAVSREILARVGDRFLYAVTEAGKIYRHIAACKDKNSFITEVSMDEAEHPQTPVELFFILSALAAEGIPTQTIAPKFTGRFNKGVDYVGDVAQFGKEFEQDLHVIRFAIDEFGLPENLKLSVHSGSDKFAIYKPMGEAIRKLGAGLHLKTAGTTWLEELIGLASAGGDGLKLAKTIYREAHGRFDELCKPYATVIDIDPDQLPTPDDADTWDEGTYTKTLRHDLSCDSYNLHFRQLLHVGYKVAAEMGSVFTDALKAYRGEIAENVIENILERHIKRIFI